MNQLQIEMAQAIAGQVHPEKIILFGSRARGEAGPDSDIDLLIIMPTEHRGEDELRIRRLLSRFKVPVDIDVIVRTPEEYLHYRQVPGRVEKAALYEGKVLYGTGHVPSDFVAQAPPPYGEVTRRWIQLAETDFRAANRLLELGEALFWNQICFLAQQCAEKYLKALLVWKRIDFRKQHDLTKLSALLPAEIQQELRAADLELLSPYAVETRYGFEPQCTSRAHAERAVEAAERVRQVARNCLR